MKKFRYKGYDAQSIAQSGTLEAENYSAAYAALQFQGVTVVSLIPERANLFGLFFDFVTKIKLGGRWTSVFFRELSVMLDVMTLHDVLKTLEQASDDKTEKKILSELIDSIEGGENFGTALKNHEIIFGGDSIQSVEIGETSGKLQEVTARLAEQLERSYTTGKKVRAAMYYPLTVFFAAIIAAIIMINLTLPVFESFYQSQGGELPLITSILLTGGKFLKEHIFFVAIIFFAAIIFFVIIYREISAIKFFSDRLKINVKIFREIELRNLFSRLSFLLESGITLDAAIKLSAESSGNLYVRQILSDMQFSVERGEKLGAVFRKLSKNFSRLYLGLIVTGEESGRLVEVLRQCESMADFEIDEILRTLPAKAEIYGTLTAGIIVGALVFSIVLPILNMTNLF